MSLTGKAASGAVWTITTSLLARVVGLVGTVVITHYLAPSVMGEVAAATVLAFTASWISHWGFNQYVVVKGHENADALFHVAVLHLSFGAIALIAVVVLEDHFTEMFNAPNLGMYLPGMVLAVAIKRIASIPDKLLMRDMRFRVAAIASALGEFTPIPITIAVVIVSLSRIRSPRSQPQAHERAVRRVNEISANATHLGSRIRRQTAVPQWARVPWRPPNG